MIFLWGVPATFSMPSKTKGWLVVRMGTLLSQLERLGMPLWVIFKNKKTAGSFFFSCLGGATPGWMWQLRSCCWTYRQTYRHQFSPKSGKRKRWRGEQKRKGVRRTTWKHQGSRWRGRRKRRCSMPWSWNSSANHDEDYSTPDCFPAIHKSCKGMQHSPTSLRTGECRC